MTGRKRISNYSSSVGFGYVTIPYDTDRDKFIKTCLRKERIAIQLDYGGGVINNCYVSKQILNQIKFPETKNELGSAVAYIVPDFFDIPIIIGIISKEDETQLLEENSFKHEVDFNNSIVSVLGKGKTGELFIDVNSDFASGGNIYISLKNKDNKAKLDVKCFGGVNIYAEDDITLKTLKTACIRSFYVDENGEEKLNSELSLNEDNFEIEDKNKNKIISNSNGEIIIQPNSKCKIFEGSSPLVKGDELKKQLEILSLRVSLIIEALNAGSAAPITIQTFVAAMLPVLALIPTEENFNNINSEKSFTD